MTQYPKCRFCGCDEGFLIHYEGCTLWKKEDDTRYVKFIPRPEEKKP